MPTHLEPSCTTLTSTIVPLETQEALRRTLPHAQIVEMPALGHYPSDERPEEFLAIVDRFLASTDSRR